MILDLPGQVDILDPLSISRFCDIERTMQRNQLIVYKHGSSTQLTVGRLVKMTRHPPQGWYDGNNRDNLENEIDENEWMGVVDWIGLPFSSPGDSGSLIFAIEDGINIPLGIHAGAPENQECSYFISIETFCYAAEAEGWEIR